MTDPIVDAIQATEAELKMILSVPAVFSNKVYLSPHQIGLRITFAEHRGVGDTPEARQAVYLGVPDAMALRDLITESLKQFSIVSADGGEEVGK